MKEEPNKPVAPIEEIRLSGLSDDSSIAVPEVQMEGGKVGKDEASSYRQIFKATSLFGGVQVFNILIGIVRVKIVAVLLGAAGVGIMGLLNAPRDLILSVTGLGIAISAVRDVSKAYGTGDGNQIAKTIVTLRRWSWVTGLLGAFVILIMAPLLSLWSFGNDQYTWAFVWLSVTMVLRAVSSGQMAVLQGARKLKELAKAGVTGSVLGLVISVPLYYFYGLEGIVPALILTAVATLLRSWYFSRQVKIERIELSYKETWHSGLSMARLGIFMTLAGFISTLSSYVLNAFMSNQGGVEQVGLYNAGWGVVGQYTGVVFGAMATDYFPRLSASQSDNDKIKSLVTQQIETALLIMSPLLALLIVTMPLVVRVLYTPAFLPIVMFANLTVLGMQFKVVSWAMGYVLLAKGEGRLFLFIEVITGSLILLLNLVFYYWYGLNGLGVSFILSYILGVVIEYMVLRKKYRFRLPGIFYKSFIISLSLVALSFLTIFITDDLFRISAGIFVFGMIAVYSYVKINKLVNIKQLVISRLRKVK